MTDKDKIAQILKRKFNVHHLFILDESGKHAGHKEAARSGGGHFFVRIVSDDFQERSPLERHKMVYRALQDELKTDQIHALGLELLTKDESGISGA